MDYRCLDYRCLDYRCLDYKCWLSSLSDSSTASGSSDHGGGDGIGPIYINSVGTSFFLASCTFIFTLLFLMFSSIYLSYFILALPMRKCSGKHFCMSFTFPMAMLNAPLLFREESFLWPNLRLSKLNNNNNNFTALSFQTISLFSPSKSSKT